MISQIKQIGYVVYEFVHVSYVSGTISVIVL